jgi:transketolase
MQYVTRPHAQNLVRFGREHPEVVVLSADLTASCEADDFRDAIPDRFFSMEMAEQNMMSFAGGMAREGFVPYVHTFAVFICRRPFDQVAMSIAYPNMPVRLVGFLPGITTPGGVTHQANDDLALMRVLPNMTILECGDATDVESVLDATHGIHGPVYIRNLRGQVPRLFPADRPLVVGQARELRTGSDITLVTSGICTEEGMRAAAALAAQGAGVRHLHVSTIKPFLDPLVRDAVTTAGRGTIVLENHSVIGGLGSAVAEVMAEAGAGIPLVRLGLQDIYAHGASKEYLMRKYGLDARAVVEAAEGLLGERFDIEEEALRATPVGFVEGAKAEDL